MSEPEKPDDENTDEEIQPVAEYELEFSYTNYLKKEVISAGRQFFCSCSVMIFPVLSQFYDQAPDMPAFSASGDIHENWSIYYYHVMEISVFSYTISGISLNLIGRKYSVILANLLYLLILFYTFVESVKVKKFYKFSYVSLFIREFAMPVFSIYVAEITSPKFRAFFLGLYYFNASVFVYTVREIADRQCANFKVDSTEHRRCMLQGFAPASNRMFILMCIFAVLTSFSFLLAMYMPETPFWLALKGNLDKAEETFVWLRANKPNVLEFDQMTASALNLSENRMMIIKKYITSSTFVLGVIFSCSIALCNFYPCTLLEGILHRFRLPDDRIVSKQETHDQNVLLTDADKYWRTQMLQPLLAITIFLFSSILIPRKILFFFSYALGMFLITAITFKLFNSRVQRILNSYCKFTPAIGVLPLTMILPVEIYPAALREFGVVFTAILTTMVHPLLKVTEKIARTDFGTGSASSISPFYYLGSLIAILFIILFMPETKNRTLFELHKLTFGLPFSERRKQNFMVEDKGSMKDDVEEESTVGAGESLAAESEKSET